MGLVMNIVLGIIGTAVASWLLGFLGISLGGWIGYLIAGFIGACILIAIARAFSGGQMAAEPARVVRQNERACPCRSCSADRRARTQSR